MNKQILRLAIPNIISNLSVPLLGMVDTALMGHQSSAAYLGAIAVGGVIFNFIYWGFGFLRMGTTGLSAQALGENNSKEIIQSLARALAIAVVIGLLLVALQFLISYTGFYFIPASDEVEALAMEYFHIRIWAAPATLALFAFAGWFLGMQNAIYPMIIAIAGNIFNIGFSVYFVKEMEMTADGVALGTLVAQYLSVFLAIVLYLWKYKNLNQYFVLKDLIDLAPLKKFFTVNSDIFLRTLCLIFTFSFFTAQSAKMGDEMLAVNQILLQFLALISYGIDGFAFAAESLVGKYFGAKNSSKLKKTVIYSFIWGMGIAGIFSLSYLLFGKEFLHIFTDQEQVINLALPFLIWIIIAPLIAGFSYIWDGIYIGATASKAMRNTMFLATFLLFLPAFFILEPIFGNHGLWLAMMLFLASRGILLTLLAKKSIFRISI